MFVALLETGLNTPVELFDDRDGVGALRQLDEGRSAGEVGVSIMVSEVRRFTYAKKLNDNASNSSYVYASPRVISL